MHLFLKILLIISVEVKNVNLSVVAEEKIKVENQEKGAEQEEEEKLNTVVEKEKRNTDVDIKKEEVLAQDFVEDVAIREVLMFSTVAI